LLQHVVLAAVAFSAGACVGVLATGFSKVTANADLRDEVFQLRALLEEYRRDETARGENVSNCS